MRIYEIGTGYTPIPARIGAATEIVVEGLTRALRKCGVDAQIIDIRSENRPASQLPIREVSVPAFLSGTDLKLGLLHKLKRVVYSCALARALKKLLQAEEEKVILHFHNQYNLFFFLLLSSPRLRRKALTVYTVHSGIWRQNWDDIKGVIRRRYFQEMVCMKHCDLLFVLNRETKEAAVCRLGVDPERIVLTRNGIDTQRYRALGITRDMVVLQVGSVCENKGQLRAVRLLLPLLQKYPQLSFCYAGGIVEEGYYSKLLDFAARNGLENRIRYLGMIAPGEALNELYNRAAFTVMPSRFEAFGLAAVESLAAGTPVLIDESSPMDFGSGCVYYNENNFSELAEDLLKNPAKAIRPEIAGHCGWDGVAAEQLAAMEERMRTL